MCTAIYKRDGHIVEMQFGKRTFYIHSRPEWSSVGFRPRRY